MNQERLQDIQQWSKRHFEESSAGSPQEVQWMQAEVLAQIARELHEQNEHLLNIANHLGDLVSVLPRS